MKITQVKPLYEQVYDEIRSSILGGEFKPGEKIVVVKLAEHLQISRTPLREAFRQLQKEGLVNMDKNGTVTVIDLDKDDFEELCFCRLVLEKQIIELVVDQITEAQLAVVEDILDKTDEAIENGDNIKILNLNAEFHKVLIEACSNKRLVQLLEQIRSLLLIYRANIHKHLEHNKDIAGEHRRIFEAVKARDAEEAVKAIEMHLNNDRMRGRKVFEELNL